MPLICQLITAPVTRRGQACSQCSGQGDFNASSVLILHKKTCGQGRSSEHWKKKLSQVDLKSWVTGGTKIRPGIPSNWRIFEWNWLLISSQFDSQYRVNFTQVFSNYSQLLGIPVRILVSPVTQLFRSTWLNFFFSEGRLLTLPDTLFCYIKLPNTWEMTSCELYYKHLKD